MYKNNWDSNTELIIVTSHFTEDLEWLKQSKYPVVVCSKVGAHIPAIPADTKCIIPNIGNEASSYLKFIITYYDNLPEHVAFIHGHETSWHQSVDILKAINGSLFFNYEYCSIFISSVIDLITQFTVLNNSCIENPGKTYFFSS